MNENDSSHPLDRPAARLAAVAVMLAAVGALAVIHRDDMSAWLVGPGAVKDDPLARCISEHHATIDKGVTDGIFKSDQAALFKSRAEALCRATTPK